MKKGYYIYIFSVVLILITGILLAACGTSQTASLPGAAGASGNLDGAALLQQRCTTCHSIDGLSTMHGNADQWKSVVDQMINRGAQLNSQEEQTLVNYLAQMNP